MLSGWQLDQSTVMYNFSQDQLVICSGFVEWSAACNFYSKVRLHMLKGECCISTMDQILIIILIYIFQSQAQFVYAVPSDVLIIDDYGYSTGYCDGSECVGRMGTGAGAALYNGR